MLSTFSLHVITNRQTHHVLHLLMIDTRVISTCIIVLRYYELIKPFIPLSKILFQLVQWPINLHTWSSWPSILKHLGWHIRMSSFEWSWRKVTFTFSSLSFMSSLATKASKTWIEVWLLDHNKENLIAVNTLFLTTISRVLNRTHIIVEISSNALLLYAFFLCRRFIRQPTIRCSSQYRGITTHCTNIHWHRILIRSFTISLRHKIG